MPFLPGKCSMFSLWKWHHSLNIPVSFRDYQICSNSCLALQICRYYATGSSCRYLWQWLASTTFLKSFFSDSRFHLLLPCHHFTCDYSASFLIHIIVAVCASYYSVYSLFPLELWPFNVHIPACVPIPKSFWFLNNFNFSVLFWTIISWKYLFLRDPDAPGSPCESSWHRVGVTTARAGDLKAVVTRN